MTITARRAATRTRLLDAATAVFARRGVTAATVEEICEEAGFTRGAFYSNFESKDDLCVALLRSHKDLITTSAAAVLSAPRPPITPDHAPLRSLVAEVLGPFLSDAQMLLILTDLKLYAVRNPDIRDGFLAVENTLTESLLSLIEHALSDQQLSFSIPGERVLVMLEGATSQLILDALAAGDQPDLADTADQVTDLLMHFIIHRDPDGTIARLVDQGCPCD